MEAPDPLWDVATYQGPILSRVVRWVGSGELKIYEVFPNHDSYLSACQLELQYHQGGTLWSAQVWFFVTHVRSISQWAPFHSSGLGQCAGTRNCLRKTWRLSCHRRALWHAITAQKFRICRHEQNGWIMSQRDGSCCKERVSDFVC